MHGGTEYVELALRAGANGFLPKIEASQQIATAVHRTYQGECYLPLSLYRNSALRSSGEGKVAPSAPGWAAQIDPVAVGDQLSDREFEIFLMLGRGLTSADIAQQLNISSSTVATHRENIKRKLTLRSSVALRHFATQWVLSQRTE